MGDVSDQADSGAIAVATRPTTTETVVAPPARRRRRPIKLFALLAAAVLLAVLLLVANAFLSNAYTADKAARDYFTAQQRGDVATMWATAQFERPDGAYDKFFGRSAVAALMSNKSNSDLHDIKVSSPQRVDSETRLVTVSMTWAGKPYSHDFVVKQDHSQSHWLFYPSWKVQVPAALIRVTLPNQAGPISLDGIDAPRSGQDLLDVMMGFHTVAMEASGLLKAQQVVVDARLDTVAASLPSELQDARLADLRAGIKKTFETCDAAKYDDCLNHTYAAPNNNFIWYLTVPGAGDVDYNTYTFTERGDPTADVSMTVEAATGVVSVHGTCAEMLTVNGGRHYPIKGEYGGTLRWDGGAFYPQTLSFNCGRDKG